MKRENGSEVQILIRRILIFGILCVTIAEPLLAAQLPLTKERLKKLADRVVVGRVKRVSKTGGLLKGTISGRTDYEISVEVATPGRGQPKEFLCKAFTMNYGAPLAPDSGTQGNDIIPKRGQRVRLYVDKGGWILTPNGAELLEDADKAREAPAAPGREEPVDLFDGKTLSGWKRQGGLAEYRVENGMIIGKTVKNAGNTFLCTTKHYADFELTFEVKFLGKPVNSGCQIRSLVREKDGDKNYKKKGSVYGPQVEIEASGPKGSESGSIYGQGLGTDFLKPKKGRVKAIKDTKWNHIRILAKGPRIRTWINGEAIIDLTNHEIYKEHSSGMIGLQVHGVKNFVAAQEIAWRNIRIKELASTRGK